MPSLEQWTQRSYGVRESRIVYRGPSLTGDGLVREALNRACEFPRTRDHRFQSGKSRSRSDDYLGSNPIRSDGLRSSGTAFIAQSFQHHFAVTGM